MTGKNIAVIGAGVIGAGTAALFAISGYSVRIYDQDPSKTNSLIQFLIMHEKPFIR